MEVRVVNLDDKKYEFGLAEISHGEWQLFLKDVVMAEAGSRSVRTAMSSVVIRDNQAKVKLAYLNDNYHEMCIRLDEYGSLHDRESEISKSWQMIMNDHFGIEYAKSLDNEMIKECNC